MMSNVRLFLDGRRMTAGWRLFMSAFAAIGAFLDRAFERRRQRRSLALLDRRLLKDVGLSPEAAEQEIRRSLWL